MGAAGRWEKAAQAYATGEHKTGHELQLVVDFATPSGTERVLDIGTGAGHTALALAPRVAHVVLTDPVDAMLAAARGVFQNAGVRNAEFVTAVAERLPFPDADFDIVTTRLAAHHFDDVATMRRVRDRFLTAPPSAVRDLAIVVRDGVVLSFTDRKLVLAARR